MNTWTACGRFSVTAFGSAAGPFTGLLAQRVDPAFYAGARPHLLHLSTSPQPPGGLQAGRVPSSKPAEAGSGEKKRVPAAAPSQRLGSTPPGGKGR